MIAVVFLSLGLVLITEGLAWWLAPSFMEQMLDTFRALPHAVQRQIGLLAVVTGLILVWIAHQFGAQFLGGGAGL